MNININTIANHYRKVIFSNVTDHISTNDTATIENPQNIKKVLICRPNHRLGNLLLITPLIEEVENTFNNVEIDIISKGALARILFKNHNSIKNIIQLPKKPFVQPILYIRTYLRLKKNAYDLIINAVEGSSSGRIFTKNCNGRYKLYGKMHTNNLTPDYSHIAKTSIYALRKMLKSRKYKSRQAIPFLNLKLSSEELLHGKKQLNLLIDNNRTNQKTICLFTFATGNKCHSKTWWKKLYNELKYHLPQFNIIEVLPIENISQIDFQAPHHYSKDIRELGAFLAACDVFIGADSGIMHLSSSVNTPTIGLFNVTNSEMYQPYNLNSIAINTEISSTTDIINHTCKVLSIS